MIVQPKGLAAPRIVGGAGADRSVSPLAFACYVAYLVTYFLNLGSRWDWLGAMRPTVLLLVLTALALLVQMDRLTGRLKSPPARAMLLLIAWVVVSLPFVQFPGSVIRGDWEPFTKAAMFFFFTVLIVDTRSRMIQTGVIILGCQLVRILEPLYLHVTSGYWGWQASLYGGQEMMNRLSGAPADTIGSNELGFVVAMVFPFLHYVSFGSKSWLLRIGYVVLAPLLVWVLVLTGSRSAAIAFAIVVLVMVFQSNRKGLAVALVGVALALVVPRLGDVLTDRYLSIAGKGEANSATAEGRYEAMKNDFRVGMHAPLFGHGIGTSAEARKHAIGHAQVSHNMYGETFIELGAIGFVLYLYFYWTVGRMIFEMRRRASRSLVQTMEGLMGRALIACFLASLVFNLAQYGVSVPHWYLLAGLTVIAGRLSSDADSVVRARAPSVPRVANWRARGAE